MVQLFLIPTNHANMKGQRQWSCHVKILFVMYERNPQINEKLLNLLDIVLNIPHGGGGTRISARKFHFLNEQSDSDTAFQLHCRRRAHLLCHTANDVCYLAQPTISAVWHKHVCWFEHSTLSIVWRNRQCLLCDTTDAICCGTYTAEIIGYV